MKADKGRLQLTSRRWLDLACRKRVWTSTATIADDDLDDPSCQLKLSIFRSKARCIWTSRATPEIKISTTIIDQKILFSNWESTEPMTSWPPLIAGRYKEAGNRRLNKSQALASPRTDSCCAAKRLPQIQPQRCS